MSPVTILGFGQRSGANDNGWAFRSVTLTNTGSTAYTRVRYFLNAKTNRIHATAWIRWPCPNIGQGHDTLTLYQQGSDGSGFNNLGIRPRGDGVNWFWQMEVSGPGVVANDAGIAQTNTWYWVDLYYNMSADVPNMTLSVYDTNLVRVAYLTNDVPYTSGTCNAWYMTFGMQTGNGAAGTNADWIDYKDVEIY
jgi:hypothetical protein